MRELCLRLVQRRMGSTVILPSQGNVTLGKFLLENRSRGCFFCVFRRSFLRSCVLVFFFELSFFLSFFLSFLGFPLVFSLLFSPFPSSCFDKLENRQVLYSNVLQHDRV